MRLRNVWSIQTLLVSAICLWLTPSYAANNPAQTFTLDGELLQAGTSNPLLDTSAKITIDVIDPSKTCLLYEEQQTVNTSASNGYYTIQVGSNTGDAKRTASDPGLTMAQVFQDSSAVTAKNVPGQTCASSTYTPSAGDARYLRITVTPSSTGVADVLSPDTVMDSVPSALVAETVQGLAPSNLLQVNTTAPADLSQANLENIFSTTNYPKLQSLVAGTSSQYMVTNPSSSVSFNGQAITNVGTPSAATDAATKGYADSYIAGLGTNISGLGVGTGNGEILTWDGATGKWIAQAPAGDSTKLPLAGGTMTGAINMGGNDITNTGYITMNPDRYIQVSNLTSAQETTLIATPLGAANAGAMWYNSTDNDLKLWSGSAANALIQNNGQPGAITVGPSNANTLTFNTNNTARVTIDSSGNVGIGTNSPTAFLDAEPAILASGNGQGVKIYSQSSNSGNGGDVNIDAGYGTTGGNINIKTNSMGGSNGDINLTAGVSGGSGGRVNINGGGANGNVAMQGGQGNPAGGAFVLGGMGQSSTGGLVQIIGGGAFNTAAGGAVQVVGGTGGTLGGDGGSVTLGGGSPYIGQSGNGGSVNITGANAGGTNKNGGSIVFTAGNATGTGTAGDFQFTNGSVGIGTTTPNASALLDISSTTKGALIPRMTTAQRDAIASPANGLQIYNTTTNALDYYNGSAWQELGIAGAGITSFNGQTGSTQTLAIGTAGTAPAWNSAANTHTLNIPMASTAGTTAGLLSNADYTTFNNKLGTATTFSGDVSGTYNSTSVDKIKGTAVSATAPTAGQFLVYDGTTNYAPVAMSGDATMASTGAVTLKSVGTAGTYGSATQVPVITTDAQGRVTGVVNTTITGTSPVGSSLTAGDIWVGDASSKAAAVAMSGDATMASSGALTINNNAVTSAKMDSTGIGINQLLMTDGTTGNSVTYATCANGEVMSWVTGTGWTCTSVSTLLGSGYVVNGGQTGAVTAGSTSANGLTLMTNNMARMTIDSGGSVGIGTASPGGIFDLEGGTAGAAANGSKIVLASQNAGSGNQNGGDIVLTPGSGTGTGHNGTVQVNGTYTNTGTNTAVTNSMTLNPGSANANAQTGIANTMTTSGASNFSGVLTGEANTINHASTTSVSFATANSNLVKTSSGGSISEAVGTENNVNTGPSGVASSITTAYGTSNRVSNSNSNGTITSAYGDYNYVYNYGNPMSNAFGSYNYIQTHFSGLANAYGVYVTTVSDAGNDISNAYGVYTGSLQGNSKWAIYTSDSSPSYFGGKVGIGTTTPSSTLDLNGALTVEGMAAPAVSPAGQGRIYFDSTANQFEVSQNGGAYAALATTGGAGGGQTSTSALTFNSNSDNAGTDGGFNFQANGANLLAIANNGDSVFTSTTASTSSSTGALVVDGGVGVAGNINAAGTLTVPQIYGSSAASGNIKIDGTSNATPGNVLLASAGGNVGIGTTSPTKQLDVQSSGSTGPNIDITNTSGGGSTFPGLDIWKYGGTGNPRIRIGNFSGTSAAPSATASGTTLGSLDYLGYGTASTHYVADIAAVADANFTDTSAPAHLKFSTTPVGSVSSVERMRIDNGGNVGIGTTSPGSPLDVVGEMRSEGSTSGYVGFKAPATVTSYTLTLPAALPGSNEVLQSDSSGNLSWVAGGSSYLPLSGGTMTGPILQANGSASAPSYSFSSASNMGIYSGTSNELDIGVGGSRLAAFNSGGAAVWGQFGTHYGTTTAYTATGSTATPSSNSLYTMNDSQADSTYSGISLSARNAGATYQSAYLVSISNTSGFTPDIAIGQQTGVSSYQERVRINASGDVGIGTTSPVNLLDIGTGGGIHIASGTPTSTGNALYNNAGTLMWNGSAVGGGSPAGANTQVQFNNSGAFGANADFVWDNTNTRLGIGTTAPAYPLDVEGPAGAVALFKANTAGNTYVGFDGNASSQVTFSFKDAGTVKWQMGKNTDNSFFLWDSAHARNSVQVDTSGNVLLEPTAGYVGIGTSAPDAALTVKGQMYSQSVTDTYAASLTVDLSTGNTQDLTLTGNTTLTFSNFKAGANYTLFVRQDATGGRTVTWPVNVKWPGGTAPVLTSTASAVDVLTFVSDGTNLYNIAFAANEK